MAIPDRIELHCGNPRKNADRKCKKWQKSRQLECSSPDHRDEPSPVCHERNASLRKIKKLFAGVPTPMKIVVCGGADGAAKESHRQYEVQHLILGGHKLDRLEHCGI